MDGENWVDGRGGEIVFFGLGDEVAFWCCDCLDRGGTMEFGVEARSAEMSGRKGSIFEA